MSEITIPGSSEDTSAPAGSESGTSSEESATAAMSTDFKEIGALDASLVEWGSGGPTDAAGRPNGCTAYQEKYGKYDAYFIAPESKKVYLTFDEGYENGYTEEILDTLKAKNAKAVFFITYPYTQSNPELVRRMVEEGHILGNHSTRHKAFPSISLQEAAEDIMKLHNHVKTEFGYEMSLFRFPEGKFSEQTLALMQSLGYKSLFWSFAYQDYMVDRQPLTIEALDKIASKCHPGALYLLHAVSKSNNEVLGEAIDAIRDKGYTLSPWDIY
jgi:peptidoglycan-N-acetylmuramic acid deacetylase